MLHLRRSIAGGALPKGSLTTTYFKALPSHLQSSWARRALAQNAVPPSSSDEKKSQSIEEIERQIKELDEEIMKLQARSGEESLLGHRNPKTGEIGGPKGKQTVFFFCFAQDVFCALILCVCSNPGPEPTRYGDWAFAGRVSDF